MYHPFFLLLMVSYWRTIMTNSDGVPKEVSRLEFSVSVLQYFSRFDIYSHTPYRFFIVSRYFFNSVRNTEADLKARNISSLFSDFAINSLFDSLF